MSRAPSCPIQLQADDLAHRLGTDNAPTADELARFHLLSAKHMAVRLEEGTRIMGEQTTCLGELRGSHVHMQRELKDLRDVVLEKHASEIAALKGDYAALRNDLEAAQARIKYWAAGVGAALLVISNINLGKLAELLK